MAHSVARHRPVKKPSPQSGHRAAETASVAASTVIVRIAQRLGVHPAAVCIKWAVQRGQTPIPQSTNRRHYLANLRATVTEPLTEDDMRALAAIDRNCRLVKGQVFLWKPNQSWEDLWDLNGAIAR